MNKYGIRYSGVCCTHYTDFSCCCDLLEFCAFGALDFGNFRRRKVSIFSLVGMRLRRVRADKIIRPLIKAQKSRHECQCQSAGITFAFRRSCR